MNKRLGAFLNHRRWWVMAIEILAVAPTFGVFLPGAYIGLTTTIMLMLMVGDGARFDWPLQLTILGLSLGAMAGLAGLALAIPISAAVFERQPWLRRFTLVALGTGVLSAGVGLTFVLRDVGDLDAEGLFMWFFLLGAPMVVGARHVRRLMHVPVEIGAGNTPATTLPHH